MALQSQIEEADRARRGARRADGYSDHLVSLARAEEATERAERRRACRLVRREADPLVVEALDLGDLAREDAAAPRAGLDVLPTLLAAVHRRHYGTARRIIGDLDRAGVDAVRAALATLRSQR